MVNPVQEEKSPSVPETVEDPHSPTLVVVQAPDQPAARMFNKLGLLDKLLTPIILLSMIIGVVIGEFVPNVQNAFNTVRFDSVSVPIAIGLILMMWPILTKVQYERLFVLFSSREMYRQILVSLVFNWLLGPFVMVGLAWATLPDLPTYREGVILVGLARCIAMVMIWNELARGDTNYCAILVIINSVLQIILYSPYALLCINVIGGGKNSSIRVSYRQVAISVLIYLGIPLLAGITTRAAVCLVKSRAFFETRFLPIFSPLALIGLVYTILVMFAYQGHQILHNLGPVFRVFVPMIGYFVIMWFTAFGLSYYLGIRKRGVSPDARYETAVVQSFTAGSNNFELAIAVAIAVYGVDSNQALAATIGPLVEVPVMLGLTFMALMLRQKLRWDDKVDEENR